jgi:hypothetical protein
MGVCRAACPSLSPPEAYRVPKASSFCLCSFAPKDGKDDLVVDSNLIEQIVFPGIFRVVRMLHKTIVGYKVMRQIPVVRVPQTLSLGGINHVEGCFQGRPAIGSHVDDVAMIIPEDLLQRLSVGQAPIVQLISGPQVGSGEC